MSLIMHDRRELVRKEAKLNDEKVLFMLILNFSIAIYAYDSNDQIPRWTVSEGFVTIKKVGEFILNAPKGIPRSSGRENHALKVVFYFGKTEIKVETHVLGSVTTFTLEYAENLLLY